ncbi:MAG: beta-lactamase family protein [Leptolyngbya sp. SIO4C5]|nr:beta-lactamase family protein [Leptolyngbya sp. SIO4C5]
MWKLILLSPLWLTVMGNAIARPQPRVCSPTAEYRGGHRHSGISIESLPTEFDLSGNLDAALTERLSRTLHEALAASGAPGVTAAVGIPGEGLWSETVGLAAIAPETPLTDSSVFWWASVGKLFTASVILQQVAEAQLTLNQTVDTWFPDYPQAPVITVEHLLTHTGGVFSFQQDRSLRDRPGYTPPEELIDIAARHGADFCPGEYWSYSNTGYVILAQIAEAVDGRLFPDVVRDRLLTPLNLTGTEALSPEQIPSHLAIGHGDGGPDSDFQPSVPFGAGNIVAPAEEMVRFLAALLSGEVYPRHLLRDGLAELYPMYDDGTYYGQGIMLYDIDADADSIRWLGHSGGTPSVKAVVAYDLERQIFVAVAVNADAPAEAIAWRLIQSFGV